MVAINRSKPLRHVRHPDSLVTVIPGGMVHDTRLVRHGSVKEHPVASEAPSVRVEGMGSHRATVCRR